MKRRTLAHLLTATLSLALLGAAPFVRAAADEAPDALIKRVSAEVLDNIKTDKAVKAGDLSKVLSLVDSKIMPNVNFTRMTAAAVAATGARPRPSSKRSCRKNSRSC